MGLTASIGVEKATTADEAKESILTIMGNLDVTTISEVKDADTLRELHQTVPRPKEGYSQRSAFCYQSRLQNMLEYCV